MAKAKPSKKYTVIASFMGECCMHTHIEVYAIPAKNARTAAKIIRDQLNEDHKDVGDVFVFKGDPRHKLTMTGAEDEDQTGRPEPKKPDQDLRSNT